jgi:dihydrofolate reductase
VSESNARLVVSVFITLDGVMEAPGGEPSHPHTGWVGPYFCPALEQAKFDETLEVDALLIGRITYESFAGAWPTYEGAFADRMNTMPKFVVSSTLVAPLSWTNATLLDGPVEESVPRLLAELDGPIMVNGSGTLIRSLLAADLVDELRLVVFPVVIGGGIRPFSDDRELRRFRLTDTQPFETGAVGYTYARDR